MITNMPEAPQADASSQRAIDSVITLARKASRRIMRHHTADAPPEVETKPDGSPVTLADKASHQVLATGLTELFPGIPVISEESALPPFETRRNWSRYFLVDPLDGTKEFIAGRDEFCVCVALMERDRPLWGVIVLPVTGIAYAGGRQVRAVRCTPGEPSVPIRSSGRTDRDPRGLRAILSRSHPSPGMDAALQELNVSERLEVGAAVKFCRIAEGRADLYQRFNPTMEWDTAAGQAIVEAAGGSMHGLDGNDFLYNKKSLKNPGFICRG